WHCTAGANTPGRGSTVHEGSVWPIAHATHRVPSQRWSFAQPDVAEHVVETSTHAPTRHTRPAAQSALARHSGDAPSPRAASIMTGPRSVSASMLGRPA